MSRILFSILVALVLAASAPAKDRNFTPAFASSTAATGSTTAGSKVLIFILSADFTGTIGGVAFSGATDAYLELRAPEGDGFASVSWTRSAGTVRVIQY